MLKAEFRLPGVTLFVRWFSTSCHQRFASTVLNKLPLEKKTKGKKKPNPEGKRWWTGVVLFFIESGMQISKSKAMGAEIWVVGFSHCTASPASRNTAQLWNTGQKAPKTSLPQRGSKRSVRIWVFVQNKDRPWPARAPYGVTVLS